MNEREVRIINRFEQMPLATEVIRCFGAENRLAQGVINDLQVVVDEALNNIISYGYGADVQGEIMLRIENRPGAVVVMIEDEGRPFDPLKVPPPSLEGTLRTRTVGGLGVHFMRHLMDDVSYARVGNANRLQLIKKIAT